MSQYLVTRQEIGSLDLDKTITDNAICYSDGRNSGIHIKVTEQTADSIKFSIEFPDYDNMDIWQSVSNSDESNLLSNIMASEVKTTADKNNMYVLAQDFSSSTVVKYSGDKWTNLGKCSTSAGNGAIVIFNNEVYVLFVDFKGKCELKKYSNNTVSTLNIGSNKIQALLWNNLEDISPLCKAAEI